MERSGESEGGEEEEKEKEEEEEEELRGKRERRRKRKRVRKEREGRRRGRARREGMEGEEQEEGRRRSRRKRVSQHCEGGSGTTQSLEQLDGKLECDIQKEHRGQHEGRRFRLTGVCASFEDARANLENDRAMDELAKAQQHQTRCQDEVKHF